MTHFLDNKNVHYLLGGEVQATRLLAPYDNLLCDFLNARHDEIDPQQEPP